MESPPSLEAAPLSEDSGLIITSGSFSSDSGLLHITSEVGIHTNLDQLQESDYDEKSLSQYDSQDVSEHMYGDNFNTVKKGPVKLISTTIDPPSQFQDKPRLNLSGCTSLLLSRRTEPMAFEGSKTCDRSSDWRQSIRRYNAPRLLHFSPCHSSVRPSSRSSLQTSRLSSSHNSLTTQTETDDSSFITQAISHDTLSTGTSDIADMYNVPFDSDIYTVPIDSVRPSQTSAFQRSRNQNTRNNRMEYTNVVNDLPLPPRIPITSKGRTRINSISDSKRHSIPGTSWTNKTQSIVKFNEIDIISKPIPIRSEAPKLNKVTISPEDSRKVNNNNVSFNSLEENLDRITDENIESNNNLRKSKKNMFTMRYNKKHKDNEEDGKSDEQKMAPVKKSPVKNLSLNFKQTLCNLFRLKKTASVECSDDESSARPLDASATMQKVAQRALPSVPQTPNTDTRHKETDEESNLLDFPKSIQIVKDYGWYWGPISVEASEKLLSTEPDGSFILRDSSDDHYIFTISFKLNGGVRHVRIEHDQGKFCFGSCTMFMARTIVEFIENAVETSRSGRYLFFLNLRPVLGPVRVQLLYPVSRYKRVQSLQHMCRFVILKYVRRDLIDELRLPRRLIDYLSTPQYYSECLSES